MPEGTRSADIDTTTQEKRDQIGGGGNEANMRSRGGKRPAGGTTEASMKQPHNRQAMRGWGNVARRKLRRVGTRMFCMAAPQHFITLDCIQMVAAQLPTAGVDPMQRG